MNLVYLKLAGLLSFVASLMHIAIIFGGPAWYRFFGAGEGMVRMAERGMWQPTVITLCVALVLAIWGAYAWSAANVIFALPFQKAVLILITVIYLLRGAAGLIVPYIWTSPLIAQNSPQFWFWSSLICLIVGLVHLMGIVGKWFG